MDERKVIPLRLVHNIKDRAPQAELDEAQAQLVDYLEKLLEAARAGRVTSAVWVALTPPAASQYSYGVIEQGIVRPDELARVVAHIRSMSRLIEQWFDSQVRSSKPPPG
jgi:hypothetical protein